MQLQVVGPSVGRRAEFSVYPFEVDANVYIHNLSKNIASKSGGHRCIGAFSFLESNISRRWYQVDTRRTAVVAGDPGLSSASTPRALYGSKIETCIHRESGVPKTPTSTEGQHHRRTRSFSIRVQLSQSSCVWLANAGNQAESPAVLFLFFHTEHCAAHDGTKAIDCCTLAKELLLSLSATS